MYRETLMNQWQNLCCDFAGEYELLRNQRDAVTAFNRWYEARIHRWGSITYSEGILLEQEKNPNFTKELQLILKSFRFHDVELKNKKPFGTGIVAGTVAGIIAGGVLMAFHVGQMKAIASGCVLFVTMAVTFQKKNTDDEKQNQKHMKDEYLQQLMDYQDKLEAVCDKYQVN